MQVNLITQVDRFDYLFHCDLGRAVIKGPLRIDPATLESFIEYIIIGLSLIICTLCHLRLLILSLLLNESFSY